MAVTFGFYNSINNDRVYDARDLSRLFDGIINDGIFMSIGEYFRVTAQTDMDILIGAGRAWFNSSWILNDSPLLMSIDDSDLVLNRIDIVAIEINASQETRTNSIKIIKGTPASSAVPPALINTELVHQYPLAHVYVGAGVSSIVTANITNKIGTASTPFITGILSTINSAALIAQWQDEFDIQMDTWGEVFDDLTDLFNTWFGNSTVEWTGDFNDWFDNIKGLLGTDPAGELAQAILDHKNAAMPHMFTDGEVEFRWGLSAIDGVVYFNYEEVV